MSAKLKLNFWQIINMNVGFFGIQYSFGLQQSAVNPIYDFLGANPDQIPILNLAGPLTGLLIQPIIGAMSDKTWHPRWGRRKPYFFVLIPMCNFNKWLSNNFNFISKQITRYDIIVSDHGLCFFLHHTSKAYISYVC